MTQIPVEKFLKDFPLFQNCSEDFLNTCLKTARYKAHPKAHILFTAEEPADYFFIIKSGWVKLYRETTEGLESVYRTLTCGDIFGEANAFDKEPLYAYSAEVVEQAEIISIPLALLKTEINTNHTFTKDLLVFLNKSLRTQEREIEHRNLQTAPQRVACFLLCLHEQNGGQKNTPTHLPFDKTLLAGKLGMKPETLSRALNTLKQHTGIQIKGTSVCIDDVKKLSAYACPHCTVSFPCQDT